MQKIRTKRLRARRMSGSTELQQLAAGLLVATVFGACAAPLQEDPLPPEGAASWEIQGAEEILTFVLFDPEALGFELRSGLRFLRAEEAPMPFVQEYVGQHPEVAGWGVSFVEITQQGAFMVDGRAPTLPEDGAIALWFAPVDASELVEMVQGEPLSQAILEAEGCVAGLGIWMQDREFVEYMRKKGHHAEFAETTLRREGENGYRGALRMDGLMMEVFARTDGEPQVDPTSGTQVLLSPMAGRSRAVVITASNPSHQDCVAKWSHGGTHALGRSVLVGPTFRTTYPRPLTGRAFLLTGRE